MTKKELIKAIKSCKYVYANCAGMTEHDGFDIQIVKSELLWTLKHLDTSEWTEDWFRAVIRKANKVQKFDELYIG